jgi:pimeloyl-ACP methyl ester carboxylesterase
VTPAATPGVTEGALPVGDRVVLVREAGDREGYPVIYFHGTPGSRLDLSFGDPVAAGSHIRLISFDRPGYGGSTAAPFSLRSVAEDTSVVADWLGLGPFATVGDSGGGPFALAAATLDDGRVARVGVASGPGPFELVPGEIDQLDENDRAAYAHLPHDPVRAARGFAHGFVGLRNILLDGDDAAVLAAFADKLSRRDRVLMEDPRFGPALIGSLREGLRAGVEGEGGTTWPG